MRPPKAKTKKITVQDIPQGDIDEIMNNEKISRRTKLTKISQTTGICCHSTCREKPAQKLVLFKLNGITKIERYCLEHFAHSAYEDKKKEKRKRVKKK